MSVKADETGFIPAEALDEVLKMEVQRHPRDDRLSFPGRMSVEYG
jgi:hypothetical protein